MKKAIITLLMLLLTIGGHAMIETLTLEDLSHGADMIVRGTIKGIKSAGKIPEGPEVLACLFETVEVFKGNSKSGDNLKIKNYRGIEDAPEFKEGGQYLLFLKKVESHFEIVNGVQGSWPVDENGKFLGMGTDISIERLKTAIAAPPTPKTLVDPVEF